MFFRKPDRTILLDIWQQMRGNHQVTSNNLARMEQKLMSMIEDVKAKLDKMDDVIKAVVSVIDQLKAAYDYLKNHPVVKEDPALKDVADRLDAASSKLADEIAKVSVSGSV